MSKTEEKMVLGTEAFNCGIQKSLIHAGKQQLEYPDGTKVFFHYKSIIQEDGTVLDDSKKLIKDKPMELIIGKKFKLEVWERALKTMWLNEVAKFSVTKELLWDYPVAAKQLREYYESISHKDCNKKHHEKKKNNIPHHSCGHNIMEHGVGYPDLDALLKNPKNLDFIFDLIRIEKPGEYEKESWAMSEEERLERIPQLKEEGNSLVAQKMYKEAAKKYEEALRDLEQFMLKEKPNDIEWNELNDLKLPILSNFSLCCYHNKEFYDCIEHTTYILEFQQENVKALFRRGRAHMGVWNTEEARHDMEKCLRIDSTMKKDVEAQLEYLKQIILKRDKEERGKFEGKLFA